MSRSDLDFSISFEPDIPKLTHQNGIKPVHAGNKTFMHKTRELQALEMEYIVRLAEHAPDKPWDCPIHLTTAWYFKSPKAEKGKFKTTKPDTDNLVKTLKDCMKLAGFFVDDALVAVETTAKIWVGENESHGIHIRMKDLTDENKR